MMVLSVFSFLCVFCSFIFLRFGVRWCIGAQSGLSTVHLLLWEWICDLTIVYF